jgi:hypothetical protein
MRRLFIIPMAIAALVALLAGCAAPSTGSPGSGSPGTGPTGAGSTTVTQPSTTVGTTTSTQPGQVELRVTDAPRTDNITEVWIKVSEVQIHEARTVASANQSDQDNGGWITANITGQNPFDLLALKNLGGLQEVLGNANLASGNYTQIRLGVLSAQVKINGVLKDATVPSGKLKFVQPFEVVSGQTTALLFDFDADKSVNVDGQSGKITINPVIKLTAGKPANGDKGAQESIKITTPTLPNGTVNVPYSATLHAAGGSAPYTWSISAGALPAGLHLDPNTGIVSGPPTVSGNFTITATVSDSSTPPKTDTRDYTISISS